MGADDQSDDLAVLSTRVLAALPRSARRDDGVYDEHEVSQSLRQLLASLQQQLATQETQLNDVETEIQSLRLTAPQESQEMQQHVAITAQEINEIEAVVEASESHFAALVALLEPKTKQLQTLEARKTYLETALEVEKRSQEAKASAAQATASALDAFQAFSLFVQTIPSEFAALRREAMRRVDELSYGIKLYAVEKLQTALEAVEWPRSLTKEELQKEENKLKAVGHAFEYLLTLHVSQLQADNKTGSSQQETDGSVELWAIECLLEPIRLRFRFHFERPESKTNRVTKPEWFLSHVLDQAREHRAFLSRVITPQLQKHRDALDCADGSVLFLRGLIRTASKKLQKEMDLVLQERAVFCHTIDEVLLFEQAVDDEFGYDSYAASKPLSFPRVVDVLTADSKTLFAWTKIDLEYAQTTMTTAILEDKQAWTTHAPSAKTPPAAQQFMALLDFLCRRFSHVSQDSHRYLYLSHVHVVLLHDFRRLCSKRARELNSQGIETSLPDLLGVVNGLQHVVSVLEAWDETPFFMELLRKVVESDKSRTQVLKMHLESSKQMIKNVAKVATDKIMAREEAIAVRQAISGPGSMIGPTAAFSAAYSVGSKTVKSLFGRNDEGEGLDQSATSQQLSENVVLHEEENAAAVDAEALLFSRTVFEQFVREYKGLISELITGLRDAVLSSFKRGLYAYRTSPHWVGKKPLPAASELVAPEISSELGSSTTLLYHVLAEAHKLLLSDELFSQLWKPLMSSVDEAIYSAACSVVQSPPTINPSSGSGFSLSNAASAIGAVETSAAPSRRPNAHGQAPPAWCPAARTQFVFDVDCVASILQSVLHKNPRAYLRKTFDLCRIVEMPSGKLSEIHEALRGGDEHESSGSMEQLTTILEACNILTLSPQQVQSFCEEQLGLQ